jgi:hypothetical protein
MKKKMKKSLIWMIVCVIVGITAAILIPILFSPGR